MRGWTFISISIEVQYLPTFADLELPGVASDELEGDGEGTDVSDEGSPAFRLVALLFEVLTAFLAFTLASWALISSFLRSRFDSVYLLKKWKYDYSQVQNVQAMASK